MEYRVLREDELNKIWQIDRSEFVKTIYMQKEMELKEKDINHEIKGWPSEEENIYPSVLRECFQCGGYFLGAFENEILRAIVVLENKFIGKNEDQLQLKFLHIDKAFRKKGLGRILFEKAVKVAKDIGAKKLYVSSNENKNTVEFYRHLECKLTEEKDKELFKLEPKDIHLEYEIR